jgi:hypothetical protein
LTKSTLIMRSRTNCFGRDFLYSSAPLCIVIIFKNYVRHFVNIRDITFVKIIVCV